MRLIIIWRTNLWIVMEQPLALRMERRLTPSRQPSTDANRQADLPMANRRSLLHLIAPSDLSALGEPATQPHLQAFPSTIIDGKYRSFNAKWYERFNWIEYSQSKDLIFCKACRHFPEQHTEGTFTKEGFKNYFYKTNL